jgi:hypothetical protein
MCQTLDFQLKSKYLNLEKYSIDSTANIIKTLSLAYGDKKIINNKVLYFYSKNHQFDLYKDSLTLYYLTYDEPNLKKNEDEFEKNVEPKMTSIEKRYKSIKEEMSVYEKNLKDHLEYKYRIKVPVSYESFDLLLSIETGDTTFCSYFNEDRIRAFNCRYGDVVFQLAYHKKIMPESFDAVKMYFSEWMPRKTYYKKPNIPIKPSLDSKLIWEKQTGLSYQVAKDLGISDNPLKLSKILYRTRQVRISS